MSHVLKGWYATCKCDVCLVGRGQIRIPGGPGGPMTISCTFTEFLFLKKNKKNSQPVIESQIKCNRLIDALVHSFKSNRYMGNLCA